MSLYILVRSSFSVNIKFVCVNKFSKKGENYQTQWAWNLKKSFLKWKENIISDAVKT